MVGRVVDRAPQPELPLVVVVVLTWNGREDTLACLRSLAAVTWPNLHTIVVDNASEDGTADAVSERFPEAELIRSAQNVGFAAGNNLGIDRACSLGADWIFILNNDTVVPEDVISRLLEARTFRDDVGVLAPLIVFARAPELVWYGGALFDPTRGHSGTMLHYRERLPAHVSGPAVTERAAGAGMLVSRAAIEAVGAFDERLFFLYEDVEWSLRIRAAGFSVVFVPRARVMHAVAASQAGAERTPLTSYYGIRNNLAVCQMYAPYRGLRELRRELACLATHAWGLRHVPQRASNAKALIAGLRDFRRGRLGPGPTWLRGRAAARGAAESEAPLGP